MMKLLGAAILMVTGAALGCMPLNEMKERICTLALYRKGLNRMRAELSTYGTSIPMLIDSLAAAEQSCKLFSYVSADLEQNGPMSFSNGWNTYVSEHSAYLNNMECEAMCVLGDILGRYTIEEQIASLDRTIEILALGEKETRKKSCEVARLYVGTSLSLSGMLVVLLL